MDKEFIKYIKDNISKENRVDESKVSDRIFNSIIRKNTYFNIFVYSAFTLSLVLFFSTIIYVNSYESSINNVISLEQDLTFNMEQDITEVIEFDSIEDDVNALIDIDEL